MQIILQENEKILILSHILNKIVTKRESKSDFESRPHRKKDTRKDVFFVVIFTRSDLRFVEETFDGFPCAGEEAGVEVQFSFCTLDMALHAYALYFRLMLCFCGLDD